MAQNREKDETLDLKVPSETPLSIPSCPDNNCKKIRPDLPRVASDGSDPARLISTTVVLQQKQEDEGKSQSQIVHEQKRDVKRVSLKMPAPSGPHTPGPNPESSVPVRPAAKRGVNRCFGCGKRVGLTGFRCRCGDLFCGEHRYSDRHDCSYDYKSAGREAIARENPVIRAAKILKL